METSSHTSLFVEISPLALVSRRWLSFIQSPSPKPCNHPCGLPAQLLSQAILQEKKASPLGSCKRRSHTQASQPRIVSAKGPFAQSPTSSSPRQLHRAEEPCSTQLSVLLLCVFWGIWLTTGKPQELCTLRRGGLQKALSKAAAFAPSLSQLH